MVARLILEVATRGVFKFAGKAVHCCMCDACSITTDNIEAGLKKPKRSAGTGKYERISFIAVCNLKFQLFILALKKYKLK